MIVVAMADDQAVDASYPRIPQVRRDDGTTRIEIRAKGRSGIVDQGVCCGPDHCCQALPDIEQRYPGLTVDRLRGQQDVVIKALDEVISVAALVVAGATILGDGKVVLVLDVAALFEGSRTRGARGATRVEAEA